MKASLKSFFTGEIPAAKEDTRRKELWDRWQQEVQKDIRKFKTLHCHPTEKGPYTRVEISEYPLESDEVWVEAHSGESGVRHSDLAGFVVLSELRGFLRAHSHVLLPHREELKQGCEFPVGSEAIKFARRAK